MMNPWDGGTVDETQLTPRTPEEMREYLDNPPDPESVKSYYELAHWPDTVLDEEAKQAYIEEHLQTCSWCGETREWHNHNPVRDHLFDPEHRVPIER